jgi:hypothetical protein
MPTKTRERYITLPLCRSGDLTLEVNGNRSPMGYPLKARHEFTRTGYLLNDLAECFAFGRFGTPLKVRHANAVQFMQKALKKSGPYSR